MVYVALIFREYFFNPTNQMKIELQSLKDLCDYLIVMHVIFSKCGPISLH